VFTAVRKASNLARVLMPVLAVGAVAALGVVIWSSSDRSAIRPTPGGPDAAAPEPGVSAVIDAPSIQSRTSTVHGSNAGYDVTVQIVRTGVGSAALTTLDVELRTEGEPASAPRAEGRLTGAKGIERIVALTIVGSGHWTSPQFKIAAGRYTLTTRFDRQIRPVTVTMTVRLS